MLNHSRASNGPKAAARPRAVDGDGRVRPHAADQQRTAGHPIERPLTPDDLLATVYHVLGIDPSFAFPDHAGRPTPILDVGRPIAESI